MQASEPLAELLKRVEVESEVEVGSKKGRGGVASLAELFYIGQLVKGTVIELQEVPVLSLRSQALYIALLLCTSHMFLTLCSGTS